MCHNRCRFLVLSLALVLILPGCSWFGERRPDGGTPSVVSGAAVLDWETAAIILPLGRYGMSPGEIQLVDAAASVVLAKCLSGSGVVPASVVEDAGRYLSTTLVLNRWLYGRWNAPYVARAGWVSDLGPSIEVPGMESGRAEECFVELERTQLIPIADGHAGDAGGEMLTREGTNAYVLTLRDPLFLQLKQAWHDCISEEGYRVDESKDTGGVLIEQSWSDEQTQRAFLTEARCADGMNYTQRVADINAAYELRFISRAEAELVEVRRLADDRVARATQVLKDSGVI